MKILITGANGQLGYELQKVLSDFDLILTDKTSSMNHELRTKNFKALDITDVNKVHDVFKKEKPDWVMHTAAYTNVDGAEDQKELAFDINRDGSRNIAEASKKVGAKLIAISTDYVFDGNSKKSYIEDDIPNPQSVYGESKLAGEVQTLLECPEAIILRTAWLYGGLPATIFNSQFSRPQRQACFGGQAILNKLSNSNFQLPKYPDPENGVFKNFPNTMLYLAMQGKELKVVDDQIGCPTYAGDLAQAIKKIIDKNGIESGIYHAVNSGSTSWFQFAKLIIENLKLNSNFPTSPRLRGAGKFQISNCIISPVTTADFPTKAKRPKNSVLSTEKLRSAGIEMPRWEDGLASFLNRKS